MRSDENLFTCLCEKEDKKAQGFQIWQFYWSFSNDIMAVKGLRQTNLVVASDRNQLSEGGKVGISNKHGTD